MYSLDDTDYLKHITDEIDFIINQTTQFSPDEIIADEVKGRAIVRSLEIIGEASRYVSIDTRNKYPEVSWRELNDTRNRIIHKYFGLDYEMIKTIIQYDIPELKIQIEKIINERNNK